MWYYAAAFFGIAIAAEVLGLGGIPARSVETENLLFILLLVTFIVTVLRRFAQR